MNESAVLKLTFQTSMGAKDVYDIPKANTAYGSDEFQALMDDFTGNSVIMTTNGKPVSSVSAELIKTSYTDLMA